MFIKDYIINILERGYITNGDVIIFNSAVILLIIIATLIYLGIEKIIQKFKNKRNKKR
ncbi:hypothetical protein ID1076_09080 [Helicobacter pylori]